MFFQKLCCIIYNIRNISGLKVKSIGIENKCLMFIVLKVGYENLNLKDLNRND